ncbi:MAG: hypothetical protein O3A51_01560 [Verrucomicrobia bacterium]|nr:hypothetical protein [Verrucomicrobiota bacterium]
MLIPLIALSCFSFATFYPLCFWLHRGTPITRSFNRFTLTIALLFCLVGASLLLLLGDRRLMVVSWLWIAGLAGVLMIHWDRDRVREVIITLPSLLGLWLSSKLLCDVLHAAHPHSLTMGPVWIISILGGVITALAVYDTALGHWYLETQGRVPVYYLRIGVRLLWGLLAIRLAWDVLQGFRQTAYMYGEPVSVFRYMISAEGVLLMIGPLMGSLVPFIFMGFVNETLRIRSTTSATGMLYASMICVLMGDLVYRYYLLTSGMLL